MAFGRPAKDDAKNEETSRSVTTPTGITASTTIAPAIGSSSGRTDAFLGRGTKITGVLTLSGVAEIDGSVEGEIITQEKLTIGESAFIKGKIQGGEVIIRGEVQGEIQASRKLVLRKPAKVTATITCASLIIEEGVIFDGKCSMSSGSIGQQGSSSNVVSISGKVA